MSLMVRYRNGIMPLINIIEILSSFFFVASLAEQVSLQQVLVSLMLMYCDVTVVRMTISRYKIEIFFYQLIFIIYFR